MTKRYIGSRELLALATDAIHRDADGFYWILGGGTPDNSRHESFDDVAIVHARGSLEHHVTPGADSYECLFDKIRRAMMGLDACEEGADPTPPSAVILCIDSRGGVVAGLNSTVEAIRKMRVKLGVPLVAFVNEMAASAAYALACACDEILCPASAIVGSIGTISTMVSCTKQDEMMGVDVRLITSGARKADGHPHAPITDAAEEAERERVEKLASAFFDLVDESRDIPVKRLRAMNAAIYIGSDAKAKGLVDSVLSLDDVARALSKAGPTGAAAKGNETKRLARA